MTDDTTDARPLQVRMLDDLRRRIRRGELQPGERLPTLDELAAAYGASLAAARRAVELARQEGLITTKQGRGSYVRTPAPVQRLGIDRYRRSLWSGSDAKPILSAEAERQGRTASQDVREYGEVPAPAFVAERLGVEEGQSVWVRRRVTAIDGRTNQTADSYFPLDIVEEAPALGEESTGGGGGTFARLDEVAPLSDVSEDIHARMPSGPEAALLELPPGTPVVEVIRTLFSGSRAVEVGHFVIAADMARFGYTYPIPE